jgi:hypothetical protein
MQWKGVVRTEKNACSFIVCTHQIFTYYVTGTGRKCSIYGKDGNALVYSENLKGREYLKDGLR